jgi:UDP-N-acetylglucosamine--N-acetylmuramyl-(pentapeptide) pyrophosphoryl-undecaprenol N-acetylglucosamine transferase
VGILGGSLGARILNETAGALAARAHEGGFGLLHLAGETAAAEVAGRAAAAAASWIVLPYEERMEDFYAAVDLVVCRGGAVTISELAVTGSPAIIVPYAAARGGEQAANAAYLAEAGAARLVSEVEITRVPDLVDTLLADPDERMRMGEAARSRAMPNAAAAIAEAIEGAANA